MSNLAPVKAATITAERPGLSARANAGPEGANAAVPVGAVKAALWLLSIDEELAVQILAQLDDDALKRLKTSVEAIGRVSPEQLVLTHHEFQRAVTEQPLHLRGSGAYLKRIATQALGEARASKLFTVPSPSAPVPQGLEKLDAEVIATFVAGEHPQVGAAVLALLDPVHGAAALARLDEPVREAVIARLARLKRLPEAAVREIESAVSGSAGAGAGARADVDGTRIAASVLNRLGGEVADRILTAMSSSEPELASGVRRAMFTFEDLVRLDRKGFQLLLKEVQSDQLLIALKTASSELKAKVFASLSKRAGEMLREDLDLLGPQRVTDVEQAQQAIVAAAMQLRADGKIALAGDNDGGYV